LDFRLRDTYREEVQSSVLCSAASGLAADLASGSSSHGFHLRLDLAVAASSAASSATIHRVLLLRLAADPLLQTNFRTSLRLFGVEVRRVYVDPLRVPNYPSLRLDLSVLHHSEVFLLDSASPSADAERSAEADHHHLPAEDLLLSAAVETYPSLNPFLPPFHRTDIHPLSFSCLHS
jgi:hypothetical protein